MKTRHEIGGIVEELLDSYRRVGGINYAGGANLPSQQHIIAILDGQSSLQHLVPPLGEQAHAVLAEYLTPARLSRIKDEQGPAPLWATERPAPFRANETLRHAPT